MIVPSERLSIRRFRHRGHAIRRAQRERLEAHAREAARAAPDIRTAVGAAADAVPPLAHPRILVVEDERHTESPLEQRSEQRRVRRIDRDEQGVEPLAREEVRGLAPQSLERAQAEIADAERAGDSRGPGARADHPQSRRHAFGEHRIERALVIARVDGQHRRLPSMFAEMRREQARAMRARAAVRRKVRADDQHPARRFHARTLQNTETREATELEQPQRD